MWLSEFEVRNKKERQAIGINQARALGKYSNRKKVKLTNEALEAIKKKILRNLTPLEIYTSVGISKSSYYVALKILKKNEEI
jgi:DNA invertase Pin-like site-specific DNA recombinase